MKSLISSILPKLIEFLLSLVPPQKLSRVADKLLDWCENAVMKSENDYDNAIVLPLIGIIREAFNIPDEDILGNDQAQ